MWKKIYKYEDFFFTLAGEYVFTYLIYGPSTKNVANVIKYAIENGAVFVHPYDKNTVFTDIDDYFNVILGVFRHDRSSLMKKIEKLKKLL